MIIDQEVNPEKESWLKIYINECIPAIFLTGINAYNILFLGNQKNNNTKARNPVKMGPVAAVY